MGRADAKAGLSDPAVLDGKAVAQQIKGTPGITGLSPLSVHSGEEVWHLNISGCWTSNCLPTNRLITVNPPGNSYQLIALSYQPESLFYSVTPWEVVESFDSIDPVTTDPKGEASIVVQALRLYALIVAIRRLLLQKVRSCIGRKLIA